MAAGCPAKCAKVLLIIFNIIFWLSGAGLLAVGIWLRVDPSILSRFGIFVGNSSQIFEIGAYVMIGVGAFVFITGFLGCCGALKESSCMLGAYIFLLVLVMLAEIAFAVLAFVFKNKIEDFVTTELTLALKTEEYGNETATNVIKYTPFGAGMNGFQYELKCCGLNGATDWQASPSVVKLFSNNIPYACCPVNAGANIPEKPQIGDLNNNLCGLSDAYTKGCKEGLKGWIEQNAVILIGLGIGIACLEIFGIIFAVCVCRNPSDDE